MEKITLDAKFKLSPEVFISNTSIEEMKALSDIKNRNLLVWVCIGIIVFSFILSYSIIFLVGFGIMKELPELFLHWLGGATIGMIISNILLVYKSYFPSRKDISEE